MRGNTHVRFGGAGRGARGGVRALGRQREAQLRAATCPHARVEATTTVPAVLFAIEVRRREASRIPDVWLGDNGESGRLRMTLTDPVDFER